MDINSERLNAFYQLAKDRNFHKAAANVYITQSALSQRIMKLEQELEVTLVVRSDEGIKLTEAGEKLFDHACSLVNMEQQTLLSMKGGHADVMNGSIRVAAYSSILMSAVMPALGSLIRQYPYLPVKFCCRELSDLPSMLKTGEADFIILDYFMEGENLQALKIGTEHLVHVRNVSMPDEAQVFLDHDADDMTTYQFFKQIDEAGYESISRSYYNDIYGIVQGVELGLGQAIVSRHLVQHIDAICIVPHQQSVSNPVVLYYNENRYLTPLQHEIINRLQDNLDSFLKSN